MKYFIDTHDRTKDSVPTEEITEQRFSDMFAEFDTTALTENVVVHVAHVNTKDGKAYYFTPARDTEIVSRAHKNIDLPFDFLLDVKLQGKSNPV